MKPIVPINCLIQGCYNPELEAAIAIAKDKCYEYNKLKITEKPVS